MLNVLKSAREASDWDVYPRPQMRRDNWLNLNGTWEFSVTGKTPEETDGIRVPFCPESVLSGVGRHFEEGTVLCYSRKITLPAEYENGRILLHIGGADQNLECLVNRRHIGSHAGGYEAMTFDITTALAQGENEIVFLCRDDLGDQSFPYGKQVKPEKRGGMWYTPVSGIWQSVWLERVPEDCIEKLSVENRGYSVTIDIGKSLPGRVTVKELGTFSLEGGKVTIAPEVPHLWSPEDPYLYEFTVEAGEDRVESYFALRCLETKWIGGSPRLCLNGKPYFFHGLLDQGYWPDGLFTPPDPACYADDILAMKELGFNTLRKHIKVEPEEFYYQCDKLGMIVWQDMVNNGPYRYLEDTVLPTLFPGIQNHRRDRRRHRDQSQRRTFLNSMEATVTQLKNHPCICLWTIFNEGWGQFDADSVYDCLRMLDDTRWIDTTSGWFRRNKTDVDSRHVYFRRIKLKADGKKPLVVSEFGGKTFRMEGHIFNPQKTYGYGSCKSLEELNERVSRLYREEVIPAIDLGLCGAIYTQVSDVEDELNGLMTYDRKVRKLKPETMAPISSVIREKMVAISTEMG